jgi:ankyrin repeat protein
MTISEDRVSLSQKAPMELRYGLVQNLLSIGVDPNNYDKQGNTVLMAFVNHLHDGEDDKILAEIFYCLIGYGANLHRRNRQGETALHVAVRFGRKIATRVLLEKGANVQARTITGEGVLAVGVQHYLKARDDQKLYSSIIACMALAIQYGAVAAPTIVQEWSISGVGDC